MLIAQGDCSEAGGRPMSRRPSFSSVSPSRMQVLAFGLGLKYVGVKSCTRNMICFYFAFDVMSTSRGSITIPERAVEAHFMSHPCMPGQVDPRLARLEEFPSVFKVCPAGSDNTLSMGSLEKANTAREWLRSRRTLGTRCNWLEVIGS